MRQAIFAILFVLTLTACGSDSDLSTKGRLFHDEFVSGETGSWLMEGDEVGRAAIIGEQLFVEIDEPHTIHYVTLEEPTFDDFELELDATQIAGDLESSFGVIFRLQEPAQFYRFDITGSGLFVVERHDLDGGWTRFVEGWEVSEAINQGLHAVNHLKVVAVGSALSFYVNDTLLLQATDSSFGGGSIALDAGTFGRPGLQVVFDNVVVSSPRAD